MSNWHFGYAENPAQYLWDNAEVGDIYTDGEGLWKCVEVRPRPSVPAVWPRRFHRMVYWELVG